jgi:hypothetical protein
MIYHDVSYGALTQLYAGTTEEGATLNGKVSPSSLPIQREPHPWIVPCPVGTYWNPTCAHAGSTAGNGAMELA